MSINPWLDYDYNAESTIHPLDAKLVQKFNTKLDNSKSANAANYRLSTTHTALPYLGSQQAKLVILMANPGLDPINTSQEETPEFQRMFDLARRLQVQPAPFAFLADAMKETPGGRWWRSRLAKLISEVGLENLSQKIFSAEIHAYKSVNYKRLPFNLPTQAFTFDLVSQLVDDGAYVILGRAKDEWKEAVPSLSNSKRVIELNSNQNSYLTPGNMPPGVFEVLVKEIIK